MPNSRDKSQLAKLWQYMITRCVMWSGGVAELSKRLGVGEEEVTDWMIGKSVPPFEAVQKAMEPFITRP